MLEVRLKRLVETALSDADFKAKRVNYLKMAHKLANIYMLQISCLHVNDEEMKACTCEGNHVFGDCQEPENYESKLSSNLSPSCSSNCVWNQLVI